jgi:hypothetical protein
LWNNGWVLEGDNENVWLVKKEKKISRDKKNPAPKGILYVCNDGW